MELTKGNGMNKILSNWDDYIHYALVAIALGTLAITVVSCIGGASSEQKVTAQLNKIHALTSDERGLLQTNAKAFFEKEFPVVDGADIKKVRGTFLECRPSDSNFNGLATCKGLVPQVKGGFQEVTRYCGYQPVLVGCSDEDTVK